MAIDVQSSIQEAIERVATPAGVVLIALYAAVSTVQAIATQDLLAVFVARMVDVLAETDPEQAAQFERDMNTAMEEMHLSLGLGTGPAIGLFVLAFLASLVVLAMAVHATGRSIDDPGEIVPESLGWTVLNLLAGSILYGFLVLLGTAFLVLPGVIVAVLLVFWPIAVVLDGEWFGAAFGSSLRLITDNLLATLGIVVLLLVASVVQFTVASVLGLVPGVAGSLLVQVVGAVVWLFTIALLARAYVSDAEAATQTDPGVVNEEWDGDVA